MDPNSMMGMVRMGGMPPAADPMAMAAPPPMDEKAIMGMLLDAVTGRWAGQEAQLAGEQDVLIQTLMMLANVGGPMGPTEMMEPGMGAPMGEGDFVE